MIAQAVSSKEQSIQHCLNEQSKADLELGKKRGFVKNSIILAWIVDAITRAAEFTIERPTGNFWYMIM